MLKLYDGKAYDFNKEPSDTIQNAYDAKVEFDKGYMLTFKVIIDDKGLHKKIREEMIVVCKGGYKNKENAFRIKERLEFGTYVEFKCPHIFYDLDHKRTKVPSGLFTANDILDFVQQNTEDISDFKFKHDYIFGDAKLEFGNYKELRDKKDGEKVEPKVEYYNTLELMNKVFNEYDCEFMFDFWTINVYNKLGEDKESLIYEYKNIEDWEGIHSMEGKATRVFAQSDFERTISYKTKYPNQKLYIHFAYSNDNKGKDFTNTNYQTRKYIGYYVDTKYQNSSNAKDYKWVNMKIPKKTKKKPAFKGDRKVKGITTFMVGTDYRDGIPIKLDKKTFYLHTAFANYLDGKDININDGKGAKYVGFVINNKKDNTRVKEWFTFNLLTEKGGLLINDRRTLKEKVHLETTVDSPLVNDYAQIYHDTYINNEARTVDELWQKVLDLFDEGWDKPRRTIKCKVKLTDNDKHRLTTLDDYLYYGDNEPCNIYDTVILRYITHNVDERIKCIGFEYDPINENLEMLKFGSKEKNDTISSSVASGVKAKIESNTSAINKHFEQRSKELDEELRRSQEEFNHIWLSEKIDFINSFNEYGEYVDDIRAELEELDKKKQTEVEALNKRIEESEKAEKELIDKVNTEIEQSIQEAKNSLDRISEKTSENNLSIQEAKSNLERIDKEITTINKDVLNDLNLARAELKTFKEETESHFSQTVSLDKYNKFNQLYQQEKSELKQTVNNLSSRMTYAEYDLKKYSGLSQTVDGLKTEVAEIDSLKRQYTSLSQTVSGLSSLAYYVDQNTTKISELKQTVDGINTSISYLQDGIRKYSSLSQTVDGLKTEVAKIDGLKEKYTSLSQTVDGMQSTVYKASDNAYKISQLSQTVDSITSIVGDNAYDFDRKISSVIEQKADSITLGIGQVSGLNSKIDKLETKIQMNTNSITAKANNIDLQGKVSFKDLNSDGNDSRNYTFIDGGKIMSDTIGARQIKAYAITADHLVVNDAMINKLIANKLLAKKISASDAIITRIKATDISASNITTGVLSSRSGGSWIDLDKGKFSFYNNALFIDENTKDINGGYSRTRLHTTGTFRVSYRGNPSVELNSGGITLFKDKEDQDSKGTNKIQSNGNGNLQISSINSSGNANVNVEIGAKNGYVMYVYGSLYVGRNLMVDQAIRYGVSCQKGTSF